MGNIITAGALPDFPVQLIIFIRRYSNIALAIKLKHHQTTHASKADEPTKSTIGKFV